MAVGGNMEDWCRCWLDPVLQRPRISGSQPKCAGTTPLSGTLDRNVVNSSEIPHISASTVLHGANIRAVLYMSSVCHYRQKLCYAISCCKWIISRFFFGTERASHASFSLKLLSTSVWFAMEIVTVFRELLFLLVVGLSFANSPPSLSGKVMQRVPVKLGKNLKQPCNAQSDMPELTQWKKDGQSFNPGWDRFKITPDGELRIREIEKSDAGLYTCIATNGFGSVNVNYTFIVIDDDKQVFYEGDKEYQITPDEDLNKDGSVPYFEDLDMMRKSMNYEKPVRSTIKLTCKADGNPKPEFFWLKNAQPLPHAPKRSHLKLTELTQADSGTYTCVARNRLGQVNFTYSVQIIDEVNEKPKLIAPYPLNQTVSAGSYVSFQCFIDSGVKPEVKWLKRIDNPEDVPRDNLIEYNNEKFMVLKSAGVLLEKQDGHYLNKLVITKVHPKDAGIFVCFATNRKGFSTRQAHLNVLPDQSLQEESGSDGSGKLFNASSNQSSEDTETNLPLLIGLPSCAVLFFILLAVFLMQRNNRCRRAESSPKKTARPPVPSHERDAFYYSGCQQQPQTVNPLLASREKLPAKTPTPSMDMTCSEFSSVSRNQPQYYNPNHVTYGY
ncbi:Fibroblast growth factor receptor-like 1 [Bulinus truncatus]|nr:Fibroblast growth factor receptor-like 1 [Bulinus truncatus]